MTGLPIRSVLGVLLKDFPRYARHLWVPGGDPLAIHNRDETLEAGPAGRGFRCQWRWTSDLHAPKVMPMLGRQLMARALKDHPIKRVSISEWPSTRTPEVSFIIGHRGESRTGHLLATLESIAAQHGATVECIVVEQDIIPRVKPLLPVWVRHVHLPPASTALPYCRAWACNAGVRHAQGQVVVLHDNDLLVPADYACNLLDLARQGWSAINLKRFIFYLGEDHTRRLLAGDASLHSYPPSSIVQNAEGGGSIAITRDAYEAIGGMDESFVGWGGEDSEFWERAQTLRVWPYGYLPLVHLWHSPQAGKAEPHNPTLTRHRALSEIPPQERIARLRDIPNGQAHGPAWCLREST